MRKVFFFTCSFIFFVSLQAQNWQRVGGGLPPFPTMFRSFTSDTSYLYVGLGTSGPPSPHPLREWNGTQWDTLGNRCNSNQSGEGVLSMVIHQGKITASRSCGIFRWSGVSWQSITTDAGGYLYTLNDTLYAMGGFDTIDGVPASHIAKFNGTIWSAIDTTKWYAGFIFDAIVYNGELYIGGNMYNWNGTMYNMAKWNGTQWQPVGGNAMAGGMVHINCFEIYNGDLYVGGSFNKSAGNPSDRIARWDGTQWLDVGGGMTSNGAQIYDMKVFNGELYVAGAFTIAGGVPIMGIAKWDGTNWCGMDFSSNNGNFPMAIEIYKNEIYIGGGFDIINGDTMNYIAKWTGGNFTDTCGNTSGINETNFSNEINIYPNPSTGIFTITSTEKISSIEIVNILGEKVFTSTINHQPSTIDLSSHPNGIYFVHLQTEQGAANKKLILNR